MLCTQKGTRCGESRRAGEPFRTMFCFLASTGLRAGELLGLVDFDRGLIYVRRSVICGRVQSIKSKASQKPLPEDTRVRTPHLSLRDLWRRRPSSILKCKKSEWSEYCCPQPCAGTKSKPNNKATAALQRVVRREASIT